MMNAGRMWGVGVAAFSVVVALMTLDGDRHGRKREVVDTYVTTADAARVFARDEAPPDLVPGPVGSAPVIDVDDGSRYQTIDGFGAELTGSSAHVLASLPDHGAALLADLFGSAHGAGLSYVRLTIGASDFSLGSYTYDDVAQGGSDPALSFFSVARDADIFAAIATIRGATGDVRFIASPWTAPAWMKSSRRLFGGRLLPSDYGVYANYLVSYARALQTRGIALDAMTPQNEPLLDNDRYPSMTFTAAEETKFIASALGPAMKTAFPGTKLVVSDHNWDAGAYPLRILRDSGASRYVAGSGFHCYAGNVAQMSRVRSRYPDKAIYLTECSGGAWSTDFASNLSWDMRNLIVGGMQNWARTVLLGNLALDDAAGPTNGGCMNCRGVVTVHADGSVTRNVEYYVLEHAAKFVRPGAVRIGSSSSLGATLPNVAFLNADGSTVLIAFNASDRRATFTVRARAGSFRYALPAGAAVTFHWM